MMSLDKKDIQKYKFFIFQLMLDGTLRLKDILKPMNTQSRSNIKANKLQFYKINVPDELFFALDYDDVKNYQTKLIYAACD